MKVLISDKLHRPSLDLFEEKNIDYDYYPDILPQDLSQVISHYSALLVRSRTKVTSNLIDKAYKLKVVGRVGSGVDNIDLNICKRKNIRVVNAPGANAEAVAEHVLALILALYRNIPKAHIATKKGKWIKKKLIGQQISGKTISIIGFGHVGKTLRKLLVGLNAKVIIWSRSRQDMKLKDIFEIADIISIHLSLNDETLGLIGPDLLSRMKKTSILINTSRAEIIDETSFFNVLKEKRISAAGLDVFWQEPLNKRSKWLSLENVVLTPHIAASTKEALAKATEMTIRDVIKVLKGKSPKNKLI